MFMYCNVGYFMSQLFCILIVSIFIVFSFLLNFKLKLQLWSAMWKLQLTVPQTFSLWLSDLILSADNSQAILS